MIYILLRKCFYAGLSLLVMVTITFLLMKSIPGSPFDQQQALPEDVRETLNAYYHLDEPWVHQYIRYLSELLRFDLGPSMIYRDHSVNTIICQGFPVSALIGVEALSFAIPVGLFLGIWSSFDKKNSLFIQLVTIIGISMPSFILATFLQYLFAVKACLFPIACWGSWSQTILPTLSLAALPTAFIAQMTYTKMNQEWKEPYITTARAKGLSESIILWRHALKNIAIPIISYLAPVSANILTGSFIIEKIYSIPGLGFWFVSSVLNRDYPLIMGIAVFYCALLLLISLFVDTLALLLDPRLLERERNA